MTEDTIIKKIDTIFNNILNDLNANRDILYRIQKDNDTNQWRNISLISFISGFLCNGMIVLLIYVIKT
jgi:hypothetical protein